MVEFASFLTMLKLLSSAYTSHKRDRDYVTELDNMYRKTADKMKSK